MKRPASHPLLAVFLSSFLFAALSGSADAQSQALNGQIEGTVTDTNGATVPAVVVSLLNLETGVSRVAKTDQSGVFRFPLLPLGTYRLVAEARGFKKHHREGINLAAGQTATIDIPLETGDIHEAVTVTSDAAIADSGKTELGRLVTSREVQNLPLINRNPWTLGLLQANVTGRPNQRALNPNIHANGFTRRVNYQLDGNSVTQASKAGVRLINMSEAYVSEVQLVTNGFAAEFGNTPGLIMNVITPSGTNELRGSVGYRFSRPGFYSRPFFSSADKGLENKLDDPTVQIGGPIVKDRWHYYLGYEFLRRYDSRQTAYPPLDKARLIAAGLPASIFPPAIPLVGRIPFYIFRTDVQLNANNRLTARFNHADAKLQNELVGGFSTLEQGVDTSGVDHSVGGQLVSSTADLFSELRLQYTRRKVSTERNEFSGSGPTIAIRDVAIFGSPGGDTVDPLEKITQLQENLTWTKGRHAIKIGGGFNFIDGFTRTAVFSRYTFLGVNSYILARSGTPLSYDFYDETFGDPDSRYRSTFWNFFAQDEWKITPRLKLNFGFRYDLYVVPKADPSSPFPASRNFNVDKNNFAPRVAIVYAMREGKHPLVIRGGAGLYYETPWLDLYSRALLNNGNPRFSSYRFSSTDNPELRPQFPNTFSGVLPPGFDFPRYSIVTVAPDLETMYAMHSNVQVEQALTNDLSLTVGYVHSAGRHIPVYRNINPINPVRFLADGRGVFSSTQSSEYRLDPRFNVIQMAESAGNSQYDALTVQLTQRLSRGFQFTTHYTLSRAVDDAPEQNISYVAPGTMANLVLSDPYNRRLDKGYSFGDQRHRFVVSLVAQPRFEVGNKLLRDVLHNNQISIFAFANSGERFNIEADRDLNNDGLFGPGVRNADRPVGIKRNSGKTPPQFNLDLRYSRFFDITDRYKVEGFIDVLNLFNINSIVGYNNVKVPTDDNGMLIGPIPDFRTTGAPISQESRQFQLGIKFSF